MPVPGAVPAPVPALPEALVGSDPAIEAAANDAELRALLRDALPARCFEPEPLATLQGLALALLVALGTWLAARARTPWVGVPLALALGNAWLALSLHAQELGHAALSRSRRLESTWLFFGGLPFLLGPTLWRTAHRARHHAHVGVPGRDPALRGPRACDRRGAVALLCLPARLLQPTLAPLRLLWLAGRDVDAAPLERGRAACESLLLLGAWCVLARASGPGWPWAVALPLLVANGIAAAYAGAQHPRVAHVARVASGPQVLRTTRSLRLWRWIDRLHRHAGHHVEHHLFPAMASRHYPAVRAWLLEHEPRRFDCRAPWPRSPRLDATGGAPGGTGEARRRAPVATPLASRVAAPDDATSCRERRLASLVRAA